MLGQRVAAPAAGALDSQLREFAAKANKAVDTMEYPHAKGGKVLLHSRRTLSHCAISPARSPP